MKYDLKVICLIFGVIIFCTTNVSARRGRARGRTKSRVQIGLPITGKYRDPESDQYYNNNNVIMGEGGLALIISKSTTFLMHFILFISRVQKYYLPHILIWSTC